MINPDLLRTFLTLAETRHFTRTAEKLGMTQPGVSQHLKRLEAHFGLPLLQRRGKGFSLTDAGKEVADYGKRLFADHARLRGRLTIDDPHAGSCRFASPGSFGFRLFDALLASAKKYPALRVELTVAPNPSIGALLVDEKIDVGFVTVLPADKRLEGARHSEETLWLAVPRAVRRVTSLAALRELGFVNHPDGFHHASRLLELNFPSEFSGMDEIPIRASINQINRILDPVAEGLGFTVLPEYACRQYGDQGRLHFVRLGKRVSDPIFRITRKGESLPSRYALVEKRLKMIP